MNFTSDNSFGAPAPIMAALNAANGGAAASYGADDWTRRVEDRLAQVFEREVAVFQIATGTAANALSLSGLVPPYGAILCHQEAHIMSDECGAVEFFSGGARLIGIAGDGAKLTPEAVAARLDKMPSGDPHNVQPAALSLTNATECGLVYSPDEVAALKAVAATRNLGVHMDGARFANALASLGCSPADLTWRAGVDIMSFGATKNGCLMAEAVIIFDRARADDIRFRRGRAGHLISKSRFMAAQLDAYLTDGLWLNLADTANTMAARLSKAVAAMPGCEIAWPTLANEVFAIMPRALFDGLLADGAKFYEWPGSAPDRLHPLPKDRVLTRMVCSFETVQADIDAFVRLAEQQNAPAA